MKSRLFAIVIIVAVGSIGIGATIVRAQIPPGPIQMKIVGAEQVSPIAVSALKNLGGDDDQQVSSVFVKTLSRDLELAGYFRLIDPKAYIEDAQSSGYDVGQFNFADWRSINAEFLVKGAARRDGTNVTVEA